MNLPILELATYFKREFGKKIFKIPVDPGFSCPNRDGSIGTGGCVYCNNDAFTTWEACVTRDPVEQFEAGIARSRETRKADAYLPYLLAYTATHASPEIIEPLFRALQEHPLAFGLAVSTRPDCLPAPVMDILEQCNRRSFFCCELGVQTLHDQTLKRLNRGHDAKASLTALRECRERGIRTVVHLIVGLPGETPAMMRETLEQVVAAGVFSIKFHPLHVVDGSLLAPIYQGEKLTLQSEAEFINTIVDLLEIVPSDIVIQRLVADVQKNVLLGPRWMVYKSRVLNAIADEFHQRGSCQGSALA